MDKRADRIAALHEAGHAIAAWAQGIGIDYVTIEHQEGATGRIAIEQEPKLLASTASMERMIRICLARQIAQQRACGDTRIDEEKAGADMIIVRALFLQIVGGQIKEFPRFIARLRAETETLVFEPMNWAWMLSVADALAERRTLTSEELRRVVDAVRIGIEPPPEVSSQPPCESVG